MVIPSRINYQSNVIYDSHESVKDHAQSYFSFEGFREHPYNIHFVNLTYKYVKVNTQYLVQSDEMQYKWMK